MPTPAPPSDFDAELARLAPVLRFLPDMVTLSTLAEGVLIEMNDNWTQLLGHARADSLGRSCRELGIWDDPDDLAEIQAQLLAGRSVSDRPTRLRTRTGECLETRLRARRLDIGGQPCVLTVCRDITEQCRLEHARQAADEAQHVAEAMFSTAFHASPVSASISRLSDGQLLAVNPAFVALTGWPQARAIGTTSLALGLWPYPEERVAVVEILSENAGLRDFPCTLGTADGRHRDCLLNASTVVIAGHTCLIAIVRDITDQKATAAHLQDSQAKFATIFNSAPCALALTRIADRAYLDANPAWERLFGIRRESVLSRTTGELGCWVDAGVYDALYASFDDTDVITQREVRLRPHGRERIATCLISARRLRINGDDCALWSLVDISELRAVQAHIEDLNQTLEKRVAERTAELSAALEMLRQTQEELIRNEKLAALGSLVAGIAHELNTPIGNSVTVATTLAARTHEIAQAHAAGALRRSDFDEFAQGAPQAVDLLMRSLQRAEELVRSFKQVAVDQTSEQRRHFELGEVMHEMAITLSPMFKGSPYTLEIADIDRLTLDSYPGPLGQIFTNLVSNALQHAFDGRPGGRIVITPRPLGDNWVEIEFADDGNGIAAADQRRIFDPFFTTRLGRGGTGLGLHIVYNLTNQVLGGRIVVHSAPGAGTRFVLTLPRVAPAPTASSPATPLNFDDCGPII